MRLRSLATAAAVIALAAPLTSCGFDYATERNYTPAGGANNREGVVDVLSAVVVSGAEGSGTFVATLSNNDDVDEQSLTGISGERRRHRARRVRAGHRRGRRPGQPGRAARRHRPDRRLHRGRLRLALLRLRQRRAGPARRPVVPVARARRLRLLGEAWTPHDAHARPAPPRRERVERQEPLHRLGRRRPHREGPCRGGPRRRAAGRGRAAARHRAHLAASAARSPPPTCRSTPPTATGSR